MPTRTRPGPVYYLKSGPEPAGKTQTRLDPTLTYSTLNCYYKSINLLRRIQLFVLPNLKSRSLSSLYLTACDALQSSDKKVIHVFHLVIPSPSWIHSLFQLQKSTWCHGDGWQMLLCTCTFWLELIRIITYTVCLLNYNNDRSCNAMAADIIYLLSSDLCALCSASSLNLTNKTLILNGSFILL